MPIIEVKMLAGRSDKQKALLAEKLTEATKEALGVRSVRVIMFELPRTNWAIDGKRLATKE